MKGEDSDDEDHPYVKYGAALKEFDDASDAKKHSSIPIHEQVVTDDEGRRRFHGAFTGGFSAGYYNTVGSKDGWTPSTFVSSRSEKSKPKKFAPEDFMDEEDMGDYGIAPKMMVTTDNFTGSRKRNKIEEKLVQEHKEKATLFLGADVVESLVVPTKSNIGIKLLKKLGWREGQGIGPRIDARRPRHLFSSTAAATSKVYGCEMPPSINPDAQNDDSDDDRCFEDITFAPKDTMPIPLTGKDDLHGIGYSGINPTSALHNKVKSSTAVQARTKSGGKMSFMGQAFGVGAFEDDDDDDIYAIDSMENYDAVMGSEKNPDSTYGWTKPLAISGGKVQQSICGLTTDTGVTGFRPAKENRIIQRRVYPPPKLPPDFDPNRRLKLQAEAKRIANLKLTTNSVQLPAQQENVRKQLTADDRSVLLDTTPVSATILLQPKTVSSVFDLISPEDRARLEVAKQRPVQLGVQKEKLENETLSSGLSEHKTSTTPLCDVTRLKPFVSDPAKQRRYEAFERAIRQRKKDPYLAVESNLTEWERNHERQEFYKVSHVYMNLASSAMSSRFVKATTSDDTKIDNKHEETAEEVKAAANIKMFGVMTRGVIEWHPDSLLCKRFNVPDPYPDSDSVGVEKKFSDSFLKMGNRGNCDIPQHVEKSKEEESSVSGIISDTKRPPMFKSKNNIKGNNRWDIEPKFVGPSVKPDIETKEEEANDDKVQVEQEKPSMELFKSIFAASSEESSSSDEEEQKGVDDGPDLIRDASRSMVPKPFPTMVRKLSPPMVRKPSPAVERNPFQPTTRKPSPPTASHPPIHPEHVTVADNADKTVERDVEAIEDDGFFGPLPPPLSDAAILTNYCPASISSDSDDGSCCSSEEKKQMRKKTSKVKKAKLKKNKKSHHKKKKKRKKKEK